MKFPRLCVIAAICSTSAILHAPVYAGPPDPSFMPPDPAWVVHLDLESARASELGATLLDSLGEKRRAAIDAMAAEFGLSSPDSIRSITVFAEQHPLSGAALIVLGTDADNVPSVLQSRNLPGFESSTAKGTCFMSWSNDDQLVRAALLPLDDNRRALVFAKSDDSRARTVERLRDPANTPRASLGPTDPGTIFFAHVFSMDPESIQAPKARIFKLATGIDARFVEAKNDDGRVMCETTLKMSAQDPQSAEAMRNLCTSLLQAARLSMARNPELLNLESRVFDSIRMSITDATLTVQARNAPQELATLVDALRTLAQSADSKKTQTDSDSSSK